MTHHSLSDIVARIAAERPHVHFDPQERLGLFIDGVHLYGASRNLGFDVDYKNLLVFFRRQARLVRASYYTALLENDEYSPLRPLVDWLGYNGYCVVTKPAREYTDANGRRRVRGDIAVEMAVDVLTLGPRLDHVVVLAGDGDLRRMLEAAQQQGLRVSVLSTIRTQPAMIADELRRQADQFIDLADLAPDIIRRQVEPRPRPAPARTPERASDRPRATPAEPFRDPVDLPE
jgi:uncharacterized LabA/DUF88 family protein